MSELKTTLLGHRLDLKGEYTQLIQHGSHTVGQHAQILGTAEHAGMAKHIGKTMHGGGSPEHIMALVEIVVIEPHKRILLLCRQGIVDGFQEDTYTRMVHLWLAGILKEEHIAYEPAETIADPKAVLVALALKSLVHLPLGVVIGLQVIEAIALGYQEMLFDIRHMKAEDALEHPVVDEGLRKQFLPEGQTEILYLALCHRQRRGEMAQQSEDGLLRNLPDAEEAQHMVYADGIEVLFHPAQTLSEPSGKWKKGSGRSLPIIGRESPILSVLRETVWRRTGRSVETEELWMQGCLHTIAIDTNRHIALQYHAILPGIVGSGFQLKVKVVLGEVDDVYS